ncbi:4670_t:CDS:1 [Acaulospora morrowiae]|uniref:6,7-dimethyl-8-ribityllumazine synthase n=1 Tax=Acaulospora morrowiae TaxID=94023 RepID=A0A9N9GZ07_9GLOM|nr:4670_t:CDS:1 [Acaulospora morrowiae]
METFEKGVAPPAENFDGSSLRILIVHTRWNYRIVEALVRGAEETMISKYHVQPENITLHSVAGSYELPFTAQRLISASTNTLKFDAVICIGVLIKGSTMHFEYIAEAVSHGIMRVGLDSGVPVVFGVLTCLDDEQALERAGLGDRPGKHNHGIDWGHCAVELACKNRRWKDGII